MITNMCIIVMLQMYLAGVLSARMTSPNFMDVFKTSHLMTIIRHHLMLSAGFAQMSTVG